MNPSISKIEFKITKKRKTNGTVSRMHQKSPISLKALKHKRCKLSFLSIVMKTKQESHTGKTRAVTSLSTQ